MTTPKTAAEQAIEREMHKRGKRRRGKVRLRFGSSWVNRVLGAVGIGCATVSGVALANSTAFGPHTTAIGLGTLACGAILKTLAGNYHHEGPAEPEEVEP